MSIASQATQRTDRDVSEAISAALGPVVGDVVVSTLADGELVISGDSTFVAEVVRRPSAAAVVEAWERVRPIADAHHAIPLVVVSHAARSVVDRAEDAAINWVDLAGNARIVGPGLRVHVEGRKRVATPRLAPSTDPFARRSANLVRLLLVQPDQPWRQKQLVAQSGLSQPRASKVLAALEELALVRRDADGAYRVADSEALLGAWADVYSYRRQEIVPAHLSGAGIELARGLQERLRSADITHWFTGLPAAWAYDQFAMFRLVSVFVDGDPEIVARDLELRPSARGANIHLIAAGDQKLEIGQADPEGLRCAHPTQVYLDLLGLPERASEAAEHLLPIAIPGPERR